MTDENVLSGTFIPIFVLNAVWFSGNWVEIIADNFVFPAVSHIPCSFSCVTQ